MSTALTFQSTQFDVIDRNGQPWLQARQLGKALGYARPDAVLKIYERNKDEFSLGMSTTVILTVGSTPQETRIFSLRGCHLIAMFARTKVAKEFRVWVLDVLESLNNPQPILDRLSHKNDPERKELTAMINAWVGVAPIHYAGARAIVNAHIGVKSVDDMTVSQVKQAIQFVQSKIYEAGQGHQALPQGNTLPALAETAESDADHHYKAMREDIQMVLRILEKMTCNVAMYCGRGGGISQYELLCRVQSNVQLCINDLHSARGHLRNANHYARMVDSTKLGQ